MIYDWEEKKSDGELLRGETVLWIAAVSALLFFLGRDAMTGTEASMAESVREMVISHTWMTGLRNGESIPGLPLPLLWTGIGAGKIFGVGTSALRLISVAAGIALLAATMMLCRTLSGRQSALLAGWLLLGNGAFLLWSRTFDGAIPGVACGVWALLVLRGNGQRGRFFRSLLFIFLVLLAALFSGLAGAAMPLAAGIFLVPPQPNDGGKKFRRIAFRIFLFFMAAAVVVLLQKYGIMMLHLPDAALLTDGKRWFSAALIAPLRMLGPWGIWFVAALILQLFAFPRLDPVQKNQWKALGTVYLVQVIFSLADDRAMVNFVPLAMIATAVALTGDGNGGNLFSRPWIDRIVYGITLFVASIAFALLIILPVAENIFRGTPPPLFFAVAATAGFLALAVLLFEQKCADFFALPRRCGATVAAAVILCAAACCAVRPVCGKFHRGRDFMVSQVSPLLKNLPDDAILCYGKKADPFILFYCDAPIPLTEISGNGREAQLFAFLEKRTGEKIAVIASHDDDCIAEIDRAGRKFGLDWGTPETCEVPDADGKKEIFLLFSGIVQEKQP